MPYLTTGEAARLYGVGINTIKRWIKSGEISCIVTPGGHWRIPEDEFGRFMEKTSHLKQKKGTSDAVRVLVVDDDPKTCEFITDVMACAPVDCEVICAHDGYSGLIKMGQARPHLLVLDIMMPEINGLELLHRLRASPDLCGESKILVYTGALDRQLVLRRAREARPDAMLLKPATVEEFMQASLSLLRPAKVMSCL